MICDTMVGSLFQHHKIHAVGKNPSESMCFSKPNLGFPAAYSCWCRSHSEERGHGEQSTAYLIANLGSRSLLFTQIGTYNAAVLAARHNIPFIVVAPISTVDLDTPDGSRIPIEHRKPLEACLVRGAVHPFEYDAEGRVRQETVMITPSDLEGIYNPSFDVTPAELITAIVTEKGVATRKEGETSFDLSGIV
jgi:methylthioribose-1-phosphate isomerase